MAAQFFVGSFALNTTTGSQTVSPAGLSFTPTAALFFSSGGIEDGGNADIRSFIGAATSSTDERVQAAWSDDAAGTSSMAALALAAQCMEGIDQGGAVDFICDFTSFNASPAGFTFNVSDAPAAATIVHYILFGGDITGGQTFVLNIGTTSGDKSVTTMSQAPSVVFFFSAAGFIADTNALSTGANLTHGLGWMCADGTQAFSASRHNDNINGSDTAKIQKTDRCYEFFSTSALQASLNFVSMNTDGFTVNQNGVPSVANIRVYGIGLYGGTFTSTAFNSSTGTGNTAVTTTGVDPAFVLLQTVGATTSSSIQTGGRRGMGAASASDERFTHAYDDEDGIGAAGSTNVSRYMEQDRLLASITANSTTPTVDDLYDLVSFDSGGFTYNHVTASGTAIEIIALAGGEVAAGGGFQPAWALNSNVMLGVM